MNSSSSHDAWQNTFKSHFPVTKSHRYVNVAYTSPLAPVVSEAVADFFSNITHARTGKPDWLEEVEGVRARLARLLNGSARSLAFTANTCSALNLVAQGLTWRPGDNVVVNDQEHPSNYLPWLNLRQRGVDVRIARAEDRRLDIDALWRHVDDATRLLAISWVQSTSGQRIDLDELSRRCRERGVLLVVDGIQGLGLLEFDVARTPVDAFAGGSHKGLLGPLGLGFVHLSPALLDALEPAYLGPSAAVHITDTETDTEAPWGRITGIELARTDARRLEPGNANYPAIAGLGRALDLIAHAGVPRIESWATGLNRDFDERLRSRGRDVITPSPDSRSPIGSTTTVRVADAAAVARGIRARGVVASLVETHFLRFSFAAYNTPDDVDAIVSALDTELD